MIYKISESLVHSFNQGLETKCMAFEQTLAEHASELFKRSRRDKEARKGEPTPWCAKVLMAEATVLS